ncbi:MAG TPA: hypothetical protein VF041_23240 [Gemmatimonadaceae bacterium]
MIHNSDRPEVMTRAGRGETEPTPEELTQAVTGWAAKLLAEVERLRAALVEERARRLAAEDRMAQLDELRAAPVDARWAEFPEILRDYYRAMARRSLEVPGGEMNTNVSELQVAREHERLAFLLEDLKAHITRGLIDIKGHIAALAKYEPEPEGEMTQALREHLRGELSRLGLDRE